MKFIENELELYDSRIFVNLTDEDKKSIFCSPKYSHQFVKKDDVIYHAKLRRINLVVNEILGELISEYFDLDTVKSKIFRGGQPHYCWLLTKNFTIFNEKYSYFTDKLFPNLSLEKGLNKLNNLGQIYISEEDKYYTVDENDLKKLILSLKKLIVRDFMTNQVDRHYANFVLCYDKSFIKLMPVFDYEHSFKDGTIAKEFNLFDFKIWNDSAQNFIKEDDTFQELFEKALKLNMRKIIKKMCEEYPIRLSSSEKWDYESVTRERKNDIKRYKLIR